MKISDEARARLLSTASNLLDHKGVKNLASGLMQKAVRSDADDVDESKGHWVTTENKHKLFINGEGEPTKGNPHVLAAARGEAGQKKSSSAGGNRPTPADHSTVEKNRKERGGVARKMFEAGEIPQDTMGILDSMNYSDKIMDRAVERGWITKEQAGKIKGESSQEKPKNASSNNSEANGKAKEPERRTISAHGGEKDYKISVGDACQSLLDKPTSEVTYSDTRKAIAEFKEEFKKAVEAAKEYKKIGTYEASFGASDIRDTFQEYAKEMRKKFYDIEKNANKKKSEGRIAAKDASDFLWDNAGCDVEKIYTSGFGDWTKM